MGITQSLQKAITDHPRFEKAQYGSESDITVVHFQVSDAEMKQWRKSFNQFIGNLKLSQVQAKRLRIKLTYKNLLLVHDNDIRIIRDGFCNSSYKLLIKLQQKWSSNLMQEMKNRHSLNRFYSESQIWLIVLTIVSTIVPIHQKSSTSILGSLHPSNILLNEHGELLLIGSMSLPKEKNHFENYKAQGCKGGFISPQMIGFLKNKSYKQYPHYPSCIDSQKAEAYCLGLTLMSLCCLQTDFSLLYMPQFASQNYVHPHISRQSSSRHNYTNLLNMTYFNQMVHFIETHYSRMLSMVIKCLLQNRPQDRLSIIELWNVLLQQKRGYINAMDEKWFQEALQTIDENEQTVHENQQETFNYVEHQLPPNAQYPYKQKIKHSIDLDLSKVDYQNNSHIINYEKSTMQPLVFYSQQSKINKKIIFTYH